MATDLDKENLISALSGEEIIKACVNCKHYSKTIFEKPYCHRLLRIDYHPVTGKKAVMGERYYCENERKIGDGLSTQRSGDPCGKDGKHFEQKKEVKWFQSWFQK